MEDVGNDIFPSKNTRQSWTRVSTNQHNDGKTRLCGSQVPTRTTHSNSTTALRRLDVMYFMLACNPAFGCTYLYGERET